MKNIMRAILNQNLPEKDIKNSKSIMLWAFLWAASLAGIKLISSYDWYTEIYVTILVFTIHSGLGIKMIIVYKKFFRELDEMERKIQLDALAMSVGVTVASFTSLSILAKADIIGSVSPAHLIMIMMLTYSIGLIIGRVRYQ
jgi:hypothetical protein